MTAAEQLERVKPFEAALLGGCLASEAGLDDALQLLTLDDFGWGVHQLVFQTCAELQREGKRVGIDAVYERLAAVGRKAELGNDPAGYLAGLLELDTTGASVRENAERVRDYALRRSVRHLSDAITRDVNDGMPGLELLRNAEEAILTVGDKAARGESNPRPLQQLTRESMQRIDDIQGGRVVIGSVESGLIDVDAHIGGFPRSELSIVAARTSVGKTAFGLSVMLNVAASQGGVLFYTFEMSESSIGDRLLAMESGISFRRFTDPRIRLARNEIETLGEAQRRLDRLPVHVHDVSGRTASQLISTSRRFIRRHDVKLIIVDYLQFVAAENHRDTRANQVGLISRRLGELAHACEVPVVAMAQINRAAEDRQGGKPRLADLRESGSIEQDASIVILLHRPGDQEKSSPVWKVEADIAKNRNGPTGEVTLQFRREASRFENSVPGF